MRIFIFKTKGFMECLPAITYVPTLKSITIGWLWWFIEFTAYKIYGESRSKESYIKVIK